MQISAPETAGAVRPYIKLNDIGDTVVIAMAHIDKKVEERDYDTNEVKRWSDGNPVLQTRITGIILSTSGNPVGRMSGDNIDLEVGTEVAIFVSGGKNGNQGMYKAAESAANGIDSPGSHVLQFKFDRTEPAKNPRHNDRKVYTSAIRRAKPEELTQYESACIEIYRGFEPQISSGADAGAGNVADQFGGTVIDHNEDPF